tara:strand:+ start:1471 stop:2121 length:651 start_codon:yes stop_codon:yes gene_type:complete
MINADALQNDLPNQWLSILAFTDHFILTPGPLPKEMKANLINSYTETELTEIALGLGLFHGFSKMLIALGREPDDMATTVIPTPTAPSTDLDIEITKGHPVANLLSPTNKLRNYWLQLEESLWSMDSYPTNELRYIRFHLVNLFKLNSEYRDFYRIEGSSDTSKSIADQFVYDVRSITVRQREEIINDFGSEGLLNIMICLAIYDGIFRVAAVMES